jgi:hypothetical protein
MPVLMPSRASMASAIGVPNCAVMALVIIGMPSSSSRAPSVGKQSSPRPCTTMKFTASGVTFSAAIRKSPSFSRSSSSTTMSMPPLRIISIAFFDGCEHLRVALLCCFHDACRGMHHSNYTLEGLWRIDLPLLQEPPLRARTRMCYAVSERLPVGRGDGGVSN